MNDPIDQKMPASCRPARRVEAPTPSSVVDQRCGIATEEPQADPDCPDVDDGRTPPARSKLS
jgi:hypothetical protein